MMFVLIFFTIPIPSMYGIFTYSWLICMLNVGKYTRPMDAMALLSLVDGFLFWILLPSILWIINSPIVGIQF